MENLTAIEATKRISLAQSILGHRLPNARTVDLAIAALEGAQIDELVGLEEAA